MKLHYYPETDSLYIELKAGESAQTREIADGLNVDVDERGEVVGFDIDFASKRLDLSRSKRSLCPCGPRPPLDRAGRAPFPPIRFAHQGI